MDYAKKRANHYRPTIQSKVQDQMSALQGTPSPGAIGSASQEKPATPTQKGPAKRKPGETIDEYLRRTQGGQ
jgi:hypothetical protein